eukprot:13041067-Ditylum_brightwellii.AAC.1
MASVVEAELGALFENAKEVAPLQVALQESDHPQLATPIQVDNSTANRIVNSNIRQHKSKERVTGRITSQNIACQLTIARYEGSTCMSAM